ncbi:MAG: hypothetical protein R3E79_14020 [Caldilineaceae bacterium]
MNFDEQIAFYSRLATRYTPPDPEYGFVGSDVDILQIEKRLLKRERGQGAQPAADPGHGRRRQEYTAAPPGRLVADDRAGRRDLLLWR